MKAKQDRNRKNRPPMYPPHHTHERIRARFEAKIAKVDNGCWVFTGVLTNGYGRFNVNQRIHTAAHVSLFLYRGRPLGTYKLKTAVVDHLCRNRACVNPEHLEIVPQKVNVLRGESVPAKLARRTHCIRGHEFAGDNLVFRPSRGGTMRSCRTCERARSIARRKVSPDEKRD